MTADHLAYLTRRLDMKERELEIREHEAEIEGARLDLEREKFEWIKAQQSDGMEDDDEMPVSRNRGRA